MRFIFELTRITAAAALSAISLSFAASPATAQGVGDMPTIAYPAAGTRWGCRFDASCGVVGSKPSSDRPGEPNAESAPVEPVANGDIPEQPGVSRRADSR